MSLLRIYHSHSQPVDSWIEALDVKELKPALSALFHKYVEATMDYCRRTFQMVVQQSLTSQALTICKILEGLLPKVPADRTLVIAIVAMPQGSRRQSRCKHYAFQQELIRGQALPEKGLLEHYFVFACIWAFGGAMLADKVTDHGSLFSKWWASEWKTVPFPDKVRGIIETDFRSVLCSTATAIQL